MEYWGLFGGRGDTRRRHWSSSTIPPQTGAHALLAVYVSLRHLSVHHAHALSKKTPQTSYPTRSACWTACLTCSLTASPVVEPVGADGKARIRLVWMVPTMARQKLTAAKLFGGSHENQMSGSGRGMHGSPDHGERVPLGAEEVGAGGERKSYR